MSSTRWLITGGAGFVASHMIEYLLKQGDEIHITTRWNEDLSRIQKFKDKVTIHPMSLTDYHSVLNTFLKVSPEVVVHLAAESYVDSSFIYPEETLRVNGIGTLNILEACRMIDTPKKILICSSSEVYGLVDQKDIPIKETQPFSPANPYAVSKCTADLLAQMYYNNYKLPIIRTRFFTHTGYGRTMMSAECAFAKQIARIEKGLQQPILKHGNLNSIRTWADVRDAVEVYWLLSKLGEDGEVYNIGGDTQKTIGEMLNYMKSLSKEPIVLESDPTLIRPYDVTLQIPDISKVKELTQWKPQYSFEDTIKEVLRFWRENERLL